MKPVYPQNAKEFCADGPVKIEVQIGKDGNVLSAKAISGDPLLYESAEQAARKTKFGNMADAPPVKTSGVLVYNFASEKTCIKVGVVNKRAIKIPKPVLPRDYKIQKPIEALVQIVVDMNGDVTHARTLSEVPLEINTAIEKSARNTKFSPMLIDGPAVRVKGLLRYRFRPDRIIEF